MTLSLCNISAKNYLSWLMCVKVIMSYILESFLRQCTIIQIEFV